MPPLRPKNLDQSMKLLKRVSYSVVPCYKSIFIIYFVFELIVDRKIDGNNEKNNEKMNLILRLLVDFMDKDGKTPLHVAASNGNAN